MAYSSKQLKGLNARVRASFGKDCLIPHQTQPFSLVMLREMAKALRDKAIKKWTTCTHTVMLAMICFCLSAGTRCNEMGQAFMETRAKTSDSDNDYTFDAQILRPSKELSSAEQDISASRTFRAILFMNQEPNTNQEQSSDS